MVIEAIRRRWMHLGLPIRPGVSDEELAAFEFRHGVRVPPAARAFYRLMDGFQARAMDDVWLSFWPLAEVGPVPATVAAFRGVPDYGEIAAVLPEAESYFAFADHSIWVTVYAVRLTADPNSPTPVVWISGSEWGVVAPSFGVYLARYAEEAESVIGGA
jgi:hypothetical protein